MPHSLKFSGYNLLLKTREPNKSRKFCFFRRVSSINPGQFAIQNAQTQYVWDNRPFQTMPKEMAILMKFCPNALKCSKNDSGTIGHSKRCPRKRPYLWNFAHTCSNVQYALPKTNCKNQIVNPQSHIFLPKNEITKSGSKSPAAYFFASTVPSKKTLVFQD